MTSTLTPWRLKALLAGLASLSLAALVAACGGGGVGSGGTGGFASGPITGFGSIIVNDVRFDDGSASVEDGDGNRRSRDDLRLGMTVDVDSGAITATTGSTTTGTATATRIRYDSDLRGPVGIIDVAGGSFNVLGQRVVVDATTVFAESLGGLSGLSAGTLVEVYGVFDPAANRYRAKRVDTATSGAGLQLLGLVNQLDNSGGTRTLRIGLITYDYSTASNVPSDLAVGQFVRVRVSATQTNGRFTVVSFGTALRGLPDADGASLKGLITAFTASASFSVNGRPVDASAASFPDGTAGLALGVRVEVKGNLRAGTLRATEVKIRTDQQEVDSEFELHGAIESVNAAAQTFVLRGQTVSTARSDLVYQGGNASNLVPGRKVEVQGRLSSDRLRIEATKISFDN